MARKEAAWGAWASALALVVFLFPVHSPDAGWHLSAGRWIWENLAIPRTDPLSFTAAGIAWVDFEWLFQLVCLAFWRLGGDAGLWCLKAVLLALAYWPIDGILRDRGADRTARALGLGLWSASILSKADLRPDLFSACLLSVCLRRLAAGRSSFLFGFIAYAVWANFHGGFILGLCLYPGWFLASRFFRRPVPDGLGGEFTGAVLGTFLNPYGLSLYSVFAVHLSDPVASRVAEWGAYTWSSPLRWPGLAALALGAFGAWRDRRAAPVLAAAAAALMTATLASGRFSVYWPAAGIPLAALALAGARPLARGAAAAALGALVLLASRGAPWSRFFSDAYAGRSAAAFVAREDAVLKDLRLFNMYEWGGWLGWTTGRRVFGDGRYLFHHQPAELEAALAAPEALDAFAARHRLDGFLLRRLPGMIEGGLRRPDGSTVRLARPWYLAVLPSRRWALVWWDGRGMAFVDRAKVPAAWLAAREYKWWRPDDGAALADALAAGAVSAATVAGERERHAAQPR